jgi:hypothetical protein
MFALLDMDGPGFLIWILVCGGVGFLIGRSRDQAASGIIWGAILGPIGWIVVLCLPDNRPKCPECKGMIPFGAKRCLH